MPGFDLTSSLRVIADKGSLGIAAKDIRKALGSITSNVVFKIDRSTTANLKNLDTNINKVNRGLTQMVQNASDATKAMARLNASLSTLSKTTVPNISSLSKLEKAQKDVAKASDEAADSMFQFGESSGLAIKRFLAFFTVSSVFFTILSRISGAIEAAIDFEKELVKVQQVTNRSAASVEALGKTIGQLSTTLGVSSAELLNVSVVLAQAGLTARETEVALKALARTDLAPTFSNIANTGEAAIAIIQQFNKGVDRLEGQLGAVNAVAGQFAIESEDINVAVRRAGGSFQAAGGNLEQFIALLTSVRATTRESAESIGTGFRTIFTRLQRQSTVEALKELGVELRDLKGQFVGPYEAVRALNEALSQIPSTSPQFASIIEELGGFRQVSKVIPLIQQFQNIAEPALRAAQSGSQSLFRDQIAAQTTLANKIAQLREQFLELFRVIGNNREIKFFASTLLGLAKNATKFVEALAPIAPLLGATLLAKTVQSLPNFAKGFKSKFIPGSDKSGVVSSALESGGAALGDAISGDKGSKGNKQRLATAIDNNTQAILQLITAIAQLGNFTPPSPVKARRGGLIPGQGYGDTVDTVLERGEFVVRRNAVDAIGTDALNEVNRTGRLPSRRFAIGGGKGIPALSSLIEAKYLAVGKPDGRLGINQALSAITDLPQEYIDSLPGDKRAEAYFAQNPADLEQLLSAEVQSIIQSSKFLNKKTKGILSPAGLSKISTKNDLKVTAEQEKFDAATAKTLSFLPIAKAGAIVANSSIATGQDVPVDIPVSAISRPISGLDAARDLVKEKFKTNTTKDYRLSTKLNIIPIDPETGFTDKKLDKLIDVDLVNGIKSIASEYYPDNLQPIAPFKLLDDALSSQKNAIKGSVFEALVKGVTNDTEERDKDGFDFLGGLQAGNRTEKVKKLFGSHFDLAERTPLLDAKYNTESTQLGALFGKLFADGLIDPKSIETGKRFATGGDVEDKMLAKVAPGEFVINKDAARALGDATLRKLNQADKIPGFAKGGFVGRFQNGGRVPDIQQLKKDKTAQAAEAAQREYLDAILAQKEATEANTSALLDIGSQATKSPDIETILPNGEKFQGTVEELGNALQGLQDAAEEAAKAVREGFTEGAVKERFPSKTRGTVLGPGGAENDIFPAFRDNRSALNRRRDRKRDNRDRLTSLIEDEMHASRIDAFNRDNNERRHVRDNRAALNRRRDEKASGRLAGIIQDEIIAYRSSRVNAELNPPPPGPRKPPKSGSLPSELEDAAKAAFQAESSIGKFLSTFFRVGPTFDKIAGNIEKFQVSIGLAVTALTGLSKQVFGTIDEAFKEGRSTFGAQAASVATTAVSSTFTGATLGTSIAPLFGPLAPFVPAVTGATGALVGFVGALKDTNEQIQQLEFDKVRDEFDKLIEDIRSGDRDTSIGLRKAPEFFKKLEQRLPAAIEEKTVFTGTGPALRFNAPNAANIKTRSEVLESSRTTIEAGIEFAKNLGRQDLAIESSRKEFEKYAVFLAELNGTTVDYARNTLADANEEGKRLAKIERERGAAIQIQLAETKKFAGLVDAFEIARLSVLEFNDSINAITSTFSSSTPGAIGINARGSLGIRGSLINDTSNPFLQATNQLGTFLGDAGKDILGRAKEIDRAFSLLPGILNANATSLFQEEEFSQRVVEDLRNSFSGFGEDISNILELTLRSNIESQNTPDLFKSIRENETEVAKNLLSSFEPVFEQLQTIRNGVIEAGNSLVNGLTQVSQQTAAIREGQFRERDLRIEATRLRESFAGRDLQTSVLSERFNLKQRTLAGGAGLNSELLGKQIIDLTDKLESAIEERDRNLFAGGRSGAFEASAFGVNSLQNQIADLRKALENLTDTSQSAAESQEILNRETARAAVLGGIGENLAFSGVDERNKLRQSIFDSLRIAAGGQIDLRDRDRTNNLISLLKRFGNTNVLGVNAEKTTQDIISQSLLANNEVQSKAGADALTTALGKVGETEQQRLIEATEKAADAQATLNTVNEQLKTVLEDKLIKQFGELRDRLLENNKTIQLNTLQQAKSNTINERAFLDRSRTELNAVGAQLGIPNVTQEVFAGLSTVLKAGSDIRTILGQVERGEFDRSRFGSRELQLQLEKAFADTKIPAEVQDIITSQLFDSKGVVKSKENVKLFVEQFEKLAEQFNSANFLSPSEITKKFEDLNKLIEAINTEFESVKAAKPLSRGGVVYANNGFFAPRGKDRIPAMLSAGESVINADATARNKDVLQAINGGAVYRQGGGIVEVFLQLERAVAQAAARLSAQAQSRQQAGAGFFFGADANANATPSLPPVPKFGQNAPIQPFNPIGIDAPNFNIPGGEPIAPVIDEAQAKRDRAALTRQHALTARGRTRDSFDGFPVSADLEKRALNATINTSSRNLGGNLVRLTLEERQARAKKLRDEALAKSGRGSFRGFGVSDSLEARANIARFTSQTRNLDFQAKLPEGNFFGFPQLTLEQRKERARLAREEFLQQRRLSGFARGGPVYANRGIFTPKGTDTIPAMLTDGEFVVNKDSTARNRDLLEHINNSRRPVYAANGGVIPLDGPIPVSSAFKSQPGKASGVTFNNPGVESQKSAVMRAEGFEQITTALRNFTSSAERLAKVMEQFPREIKITGNQKVEVVFNGAEVLASLTKDLEKMALQKVRDEINKVLERVAPDANPVSDN